MGNNSRFFFVALSISAALGLGDVWLFPYLSNKNSGLFVIPYLVALIVAGVPLLLLEFSIGQYFNKNVIDLFSSIKKWFSGIGWLMIINAFIVMSFSAVVLSWYIVYFFVSFGLQWKGDANAYFFNNVIQISNGFRNFSRLSLPLFIGLIIAWVLIFVFIKNGYESIRKWFPATLLLFVVLMLFFFVRFLNLNNALTGIYAFIKPNLKSLYDFRTWKSAFSLAILTLGLSFGIMPAIARKGNKGFMFGNSLLIIAFKLLTGIAMGFILFAILGFMSAEKTVSLDRLVFTGYSPVFTVLAQSLPLFPNPTLLSLMFFIFLGIIFMLGVSSLAYSILHVIVHKFNTKHRNAAILISGFGFLGGLLFIIRPGFYILDIVSHFVYYNIIIAILLEVLAVGWFFDSEKISDYINHYSVLKIGEAWRFAIRYIIPPILLLLLFIQIKSDIALNYKNFQWYYLLVFGIGTAVIPVIVAFLLPQKLLDRK